MKSTVILGTNIIADCDSALVVGDVEVFRLRERTGDGQLVVDFDIRNEKDEKLVVVAKNNVVHAAKGYSVLNLPSRSSVRDETGKQIVDVKEISTGTISIIGDFWIKGFHVSITDEHLVAGSITMKGNKISGFGKAILLKRGAFMIGSR
jgi:hypothetical protein